MLLMSLFFLSQPPSNPSPITPFGTEGSNPQISNEPFDTLRQFPNTFSLIVQLLK